MSIVIIYGTAADKKARRGAEYKRHYGCKRVVYGWDGIRKLNDGDLAITNMKPPFNVPGAKCVDAVIAKAAVTA